MTYIFELYTVQTSVFKTLIESLKNTLPDANLEFNKEGLKIIDTNPSKNVLIHLKLEGKSFEKYICKQKIVLGINLINFFKLLKTTSSSDTLKLYVDSDNINELGIIVENSEKGSIVNYKLSLIDLNETSFKIPNTNFDSVFVMLSSDFQKICRDMSNIGDEIDIKIINNQFFFTCFGDFAKQEVILTDKSDGIVVIEKPQKDEIIQGRFLLKFLMSFIKCTGLSTNVELFLKNDYPLILRYKVGDLGFLKLGLSPIVLDNDQK